jgi:RHS repeat-associated protein
VTRAFDTADRPVTGANGTGTYAYDVLGRTTTLPASDAPHPASGDITLSYYDNDLAKSIAQGTTTTTYTLDALDRRSTESVTTSGTTTNTVRHYADTSDNPTWVTQGTTTQRYAELIGGDLSLTVDQSASADLTIANPHGDVVTTVDLPTTLTPATTITAWNSYDEYGNPTTTHTTLTGPADYSWLGAKQRATSGTGLTLMGVRLYNPITGLFTSVDPVRGGNANSYTYPSDPINSFDLDGKRRLDDDEPYWNRTKKWWQEEPVWKRNWPTPKKKKSNRRSWWKRHHTPPYYCCNWRSAAKYAVVGAMGNNTLGLFYGWFGHGKTGTHAGGGEYQGRFNYAAGNLGFNIGFVYGLTRHPKGRWIPRR